jgi:hypothetical protein
MRVLDFDGFNGMESDVPGAEDITHAPAADPLFNYIIRLHQLLQMTLHVFMLPRPRFIC